MVRTWRADLARCAASGLRNILGSTMELEYDNDDSWHVSARVGVRSCHCTLLFAASPDRRVCMFGLLRGHKESSGCTAQAGACCRWHPYFEAYRLLLSAFKAIVKHIPNPGPGLPLLTRSVFTRLGQRSDTSRPGCMRRDGKCSATFTLPHPGNALVLVDNEIHDRIRTQIGEGGALSVSRRRCFRANEDAGPSTTRKPPTQDYQRKSSPRDASRDLGRYGSQCSQCSQHSQRS